MNLPNILGGMSITCGLLGVGGMAGAIETGTGYLTAGALVLIAIVSGFAAAREYGPYQGEE